MSEPIRIANCSGYYGDRITAAQEMVEDGPIDVLTGDWLAELTMLILARSKGAGRGGYAKTFLKQVKQVLPTCMERGIQIVSNAGGLEPEACAAALREIADELGLSPRIAWIGGDDALPRLDELRASHDGLRHMDTGEPLGDRLALSANAYLGGFGIAQALDRGADIVVTGRVTDAAVILGPAISHHGWKTSDHDALAGAVAAGHVIECGTQATGGNFAFFTEIPDLTHPGFPIAEIAEDGSSIITKHDGTGGAVTVDTVTSQLLYEIGPPAYLNPDVTTHMDSVRLEQVGPDRVAITGVRGSAPPATAKLGLTVFGGFRTTISVPLTGLDIEAKAQLVQHQLFAHVPGGREAFRELDVSLLRTDHVDPHTNEAATAWLRMTFRDDDAEKVGKPLSQALIQLALASVPGMYLGGEQTQAQAYGSFWPTLVPASEFPQVAHLDGDQWLVDESDVERVDEVAPTAPNPTTWAVFEPNDEPVERVPLGRIIGARSGDKGGHANLGLWARSAEAGAWLAATMTVDRLRDLCPDLGRHEIVRHELPNLYAINFVIEGLLGEGVAYDPRQDPQAKALGEYVRAKHLDVPTRLLA